MKTLAVNLFINASMIGWRKQEVCRAQYQCNMPFNENMLQPCPMLENPERLRKMVLDSETHSTDPQSPESADHLCGKCDAYARPLGPGGPAAVGGAEAGIGPLTEYAERRRSLRRFLLFCFALPGPLGGQADGPLPLLRPSAGIAALGRLSGHILSPRPASLTGQPTTVHL